MTSKLLVGFLAFLGSTLLTSAAESPLWTWQEPDTELYQPSFSPDGSEIALVRKRHIPDFAEADGLSEDDLKKRTAPIDKNERYADPEVIVLKIGDKTPSRLDWGWSPAFSPDGTHIAYAFQKKPISRFRILAETMEGNDIRLHRRADKSVRVLASPKTGYLDSPVFSPDGRTIRYSLCAAVNGAYGGEVGVAEVPLDGKAGGTPGSSGKKEADSGDPGEVSPDARLMAVPGESGLQIVHRGSEKILQELALPGRIQGVVWSPDSLRLAVVFTKGEGEIFEKDILQVYQIPP